MILKNKLTYTEEVWAKEKGKKKKGIPPLFHDSKGYNEIFIYIQCNIEEIVRFKK